MKLDELKWRTSASAWEYVKMGDVYLARSVLPHAKLHSPGPNLPIGTVIIRTGSDLHWRIAELLVAECLAIEYLKSNPTK